MTVLGSLTMDSNFRKGALAESARATKKKKDGASSNGGGGNKDMTPDGNANGPLKKSLDIHEQRKKLILGSMVDKIGKKSVL